MRLKQKTINNNDVREGVTVLGGIDTLYYYINTSMGELYPTLWDSVKDGEWLQENFTFQGHSGKLKGFIGAWYRRWDTLSRGLPLYRVGFKDWQKQKLIHNVQIQLEASGIYRYGLIELLKIVNQDLSPLLGFEISSSDCQVSRADLNAFVGGFDFGGISPECFRTRAQKTNEVYGDGDYIIDDNEYVYKNARKLETLYIGSKSSPVSFKIYDKRRELDKLTPNMPKVIKMAYFASRGLHHDDLWNVEFTLKRQVLKEYGVYTIADLLLHAKAIFKDMMKRYAFLGFDIEKYNAYRESKNQSKLDLHEIWEYIIECYDADFLGDFDTQRVYEKSKGLSREAFIQQLEKISKYRRDLDVDISNSEIMRILITGS